MRFNQNKAAAASLTLLAALAGNTQAQLSLPNNEVPNIGGGVLNASDPKLVNYTFTFGLPFDPTPYHGYYTWAVNNNTVAITNVTGTTITSKLAKYPYFSINEAHPKKINTSTAINSRTHAKDFVKTGKKFRKILHVLFENEVYGWTMNDSYWKVLATRGKLLTNSHGITHPSLPNYAAMVAGDFFGVDNEFFYNYNVSTIYDLLDAKGLDYATYSEWYMPAATTRGPNDCNQMMTYGPETSSNLSAASQVYRRLDLPALLFSTYSTNYTRCSKIYNAAAKFDEDVSSHQLPPYSYYIPDMLHNGHNPESDSDYVHQPTTSGIWFNAFLDKYLDELTKQGTLIVATFDEATWQNDNDYVPNNNNQIATLLFGYGITPNSWDDTYITHYGMLRGAMDNFDLGALGRNDTNATNGNVLDLVY
jgi:hypothetical protein